MSAGKGMRPVMGYNNRLYRDNYDNIFMNKQQPLLGHAGFTPTVLSLFAGPRKSAAPKVGKARPISKAKAVSVRKRRNRGRK